MNKRTAILSGVLTMLGIVVTIGVIAKTEIGSGMIKKGVHTMDEKPGRSEYFTGIPMAELKDMEKELNNVLNDLKIRSDKDLENERLQEAPGWLQEAWDDMESRHTSMNAHKDMAYLQYKEKVQKLKDTVIEAIKARAAQLVK